MRLILSLVTGAFVLANAHAADADEVSKVMCEQFAIDGATRTVKATETFDADFSPAHHAPRNIPIEVAVPKEAEAYIHFPIVQDGTYVIYATDPDRLAGLKMKDGEAIKSKAVDAPAACADVLKGGLTADIEAGTLKGPKPIAIDLRKGPAETLKLIVSRDPIN